MTDTVKIARPKFPRKGKASGRVEHDSRGNAVFKRTRATDSDEILTSTSFELLDDARVPRAAPGSRAKSLKSKR